MLSVRPDRRAIRINPLAFGLSLDEGVGGWVYNA
jgi:hypothetical protein